MNKSHNCDFFQYKSPIVNSWCLKMLFSCPNLFKNHNNLQLASPSHLWSLSALNWVQPNTKGLHLFLNYNAKIKHTRSKKELLNGFTDPGSRGKSQRKTKESFASYLLLKFHPSSSSVRLSCKGQTLFLPKSLQQSQQNLSQAWQPIYIIHRFLAKLLKLIRWQTFILAALINKRTRFPGGRNVSK